MCVLWRMRERRYTTAIVSVAPLVSRGIAVRYQYQRAGRKTLQLTSVISS